ncbi:MAG: KOW domain-containing RNA-binding protein [Clostridia bacterium]|nr:KOW domain-containing RNA-binding protein [Clostridia bacterium]
MEYRIGQRVRSKAGRDKGRDYVVIRAEGEYVYVADGAARRLDHLKRKKIRHVEGSYNVSDEIIERISDGTIEDHTLRKFLKRS